MSKKNRTERNIPALPAKESPKKTGWFSRLDWSWKRFDTNFNRWGLLLLTSLLLGLMLTPDLSSSLKTWDEGMVGQISTMEIRAPKSTNIEDKQATEKKRQEAERSVTPIYDYQADLGRNIQNRIADAFLQMQNLIQDFIIIHVIVEEESQATAKSASPTTPSPSPELLRKNRLQKLLEKPDYYFSKITADSKLETQLRSVILALRSDFNKTIQAVISEKDYLQLYGYHFSTELQIALQRMIDDVMSRKIINDKELMELSENGAITVRVVDERTGRVSEYSHHDQSTILDYKKVSSSLWRYTNILSNLGSRQRELLLRLGSQLVQPNLAYNRTMTQERRKNARDNIKAMVIPIQKGEVIIRDGERFEERHLTILHGISKEMASSNPIASMIGYFLLVLVLISTLVFFGMRNIRKFRPTFKDFLMMSVLLALFILMVKALGVVAGALTSTLPEVDAHIYYLAIPVALGVAMIRIVINSETAVLFGIIVAVLFAIMTNEPVFMTVYALATSLTAADSVGQCRTRTTLVFAGLRVSLVAMVVVIFHNLMTGNAFGLSLVHSLIAALSSGFIMGLVLTGFTPIIEFFFSYTTDIKLLELANLNHPLLKRLIVQSPGTYHHAIIVGSLVETAAESIHANPLLARVAAYYHDIGKVKTPQYFGENQADGHNPHDDLTPNMSVLILQSHVREGVELAKRYNLGEKITSIIAQHHGTNLMRFFLHKAKELKEQKGESASSVNEQDFRYPGPKPQTREAGLVMLADSVEAAARSLDEPTPERIQGLVQKVINMIFRDGQLNECELTLKDLHQIARSFTQILVGIYHHRPKYPDEPKHQEKSPNGRANPQPAKKANAFAEDLDAEDDKDLKRLGLH